MKTKPANIRVINPECVVTTVCHIGGHTSMWKFYMRNPKKEFEILRNSNRLVVYCLLFESKDS